MWNFVNTPFGIWLLSTIVIGLITWSYAKFRSTLSEKRTNEKKVESINLQIAFRLDHMNKSLLKHQAGFTTYKHYSLCINGFLNGIPYTDIFDDFKGRTTVSLLWELKSLTRSPAARTTVDEALESAKRLYEIQTEGWGDQVEHNMAQERRNVLVQEAKDIIQRLQIDQWKL